LRHVPRQKARGALFCDKAGRRTADLARKGKGAASLHLDGSRDEKSSTDGASAAACRGWLPRGAHATARSPRGTAPRLKVSSRDWPARPGDEPAADGRHQTIPPSLPDASADIRRATLPCGAPQVKTLIPLRLLAGPHLGSCRARWR